MAGAGRVRILTHTEELIFALQDDNSNVRQIAAELLGSLGGAAGPEAVSSLVLALRDEDLDVRVTVALALEALATSGHPGAAAKLRQALLEDPGAAPHDDVLEVWSSLAKVDGPAARQRLFLELKQSNWYGRSAAASVLGSMKAGVNAEVLEALRSALEDKHWHVRFAAAKAIGRVGVRAPGPSSSSAARRLALTALDDEEDKLVRAAATASLRSLSKVGSRAAIEGLAEVRSMERARERHLQREEVRRRGVEVLDKLKTWKSRVGY